MKRRDFIKSGAHLFVLSRILGASIPFSLWRGNALAAAPVGKNLSSNLDLHDPLQELNLSNFSSLDFNGDNIDRPHDILWNVDGYLSKKGGIPRVSRHVQNIVVGGGMSGLLSQYHLTKQQESLLLEQETVLGGNSKGEVYNGMAYSIGAAYIAEPDEGSDIETFFKETGLSEMFRYESDEEAAAFMKNELVHEFWSGVTAPEAKHQFEKLNALLTDILENKYPDIPYIEDSQLSRVELNELDSISFLDWMKANLGSEIHPHILEYYQLYCWSSFLGGIDELSAAQVLNFISCEAAAAIGSLPGGNAQMTSRLYRLLATNQKSKMEAGAFVIRVQSQGEKVLVVYENSSGELVSVTCDKCILACPKFVARRIVVGLQPDQEKAFDDIPYRGYIVGNILLNTKVSSPSYDLFNLKGDIPDAPSAMNPPKRVATDIIFADWATHDNAEKSILTVYRPLPYDGARQFLFSPFAHEKHKKAILQDVNLLLPSLGLSEENIEGIRLTRWGHSLPMSDKGWIAKGLPELVSRPMEDKIYFVNQDNWVNPAFETCFSEAKSWTDRILGF